MAASRANAVATPGGLANTSVRAIATAMSARARGSSCSA